MGQTESNFADDDALIMEDDLDANLDNVYVAKQPEASSSAFSDLATANDEALENIFKEIDVDDSKSIDLSEFKAFIMKKRPSYYGSQSELVNPNFDANEALDEAKKKGSDPDTIAKLQRDVHKQQSKERFEVGKQEKSKAAYAPKATIPSQENVSERNYEATGVMANILKKKALKAEKIKLHASASIIQKHARAYIARNLFSSAVDLSGQACTT